MLFCFSWRNFNVSWIRTRASAVIFYFFEEQPETTGSFCWLTIHLNQCLRHSADLIRSLSLATFFPPTYIESRIWSCKISSSKIPELNPWLSWGGLHWNWSKFPQKCLREVHPREHKKWMSLQVIHITRNVKSFSIASHEIFLNVYKCLKDEKRKQFLKSLRCIGLFKKPQIISWDPPMATSTHHCSQDSKNL